MTAPERYQEGGDHYLMMTLQPWDVMAAWLTPVQFQGYLLGNVVKYLGRFNVDHTSGKGGVADLKKARHYLDKLIKELESIDP